MSWTMKLPLVDMKRNQVIFRMFVLWGFLALTFGSFALDSVIPPAPNPPKFYNNFSKEFPSFLSVSDAAKIEKKLDDFEKETSNEIVIVIIDNLQGYSPWEFATDLGHAWGVGKKKFDNGAVLLIKPTGGAGERKFELVVGYGLEGVIGSLTGKRILENEMLPQFKNGKYYEGIDAALTVIMSLVKKEYDEKEYANRTGGGDNPMGVIGILIIIALFVFFFFRRGGRGGGFTMGSGGMFFGGGGFGGGSSSGGGSSFGGFGGGGFGGSGSGGSW